MGEIIYLCCPYSHPNPAVRELRYHLANATAARIMQEGHVVFSPVSHSHEVARYLPEDLLLNHEFWMAQDLPLMRAATAVYVMNVEGWEQSHGVMAEIQRAIALGLPVKHITP